MFGLVLAVGVGACGSSVSQRAAPPPQPAVVATTTTTNAGTLAFTDSGPVIRFGKSLQKRCRGPLRALGHLARPTTLLDQATYSQREEGLLSNLLSALAPLTAPAGEGKAMRSYRSAVASEAHADQFVIDAADAQNGEGVAYWLSQRGAASSAMANWAGVLDAPHCAP